MKSIFLSSVVLFTALFAFNLEAGHYHHNHRHHHSSRTQVNLNVGAVAVAQPVAVPVVTHFPAQPVHVVTYPNTYYTTAYPVTTVEYVQPVTVVERPARNFGFGFLTGFLTSSILRAF